MSSTITPEMTPQNLSCIPTTLRKSLGTIWRSSPRRLQIPIFIFGDHLTVKNVCIEEYERESSHFSIYKLSVDWRNAFCSFKKLNIKKEMVVDGNQGMCGMKKKHMLR